MAWLLRSGKAASTVVEATGDESRAFGYLVKRGEKHKNWKRRFFAITGTTLQWFDSEQACHAGKKLGEIECVDVSPSDDKGYILCVGAAGRDLYLRADQGDVHLLTLVATRLAEAEDATAACPVVGSDGPDCADRSAGSNAEAAAAEPEAAAEPATEAAAGLAAGPEAPSNRFYEQARREVALAEEGAAGAAASGRPGEEAEAHPAAAERPR